MTIVRPNRKVLTMWRILLVVVSFLPILAISLFLTSSTLYKVGVGIWGVLFILFFAWYLPKLYNSMVYIIDENNVVFRRGVFITKVVNMPINNIQYTTISISPFARIMGVVTLIVVAPGARLSLAGLSMKEARRISKDITTLIEVCGDV